MYHPFLYQPLYQDKNMTNCTEYVSNRNYFIRPFIYNDEVFLRLSDYIPDVVDWLWISNYGNVYNEQTKKFQMLNFDSKGYCNTRIQLKDESPMALQKGKRFISIGCHILVCSTFVGPKPAPGYQVNHKDFNRRNNFYLNLEWTTPRENIMYSMDRDRYRGKDGSYVAAKYPIETIHKICKLLEQGYSIQEIALIVFGTKPTPSIYGLIQKIRTKENWSFISNNYNIPDIDHIEFANPELIHKLCQYFQDNPSAVNDSNIHAKNIADALGIDYLSSKLNQNRFYCALRGVRHKDYYADIISQYDYPDFKE